MTELNCLDLFCGMGGWSIGFHRQGFRCVGVDIVDVGYPYEFIKKDVRLFNAFDKPLKWDVIVASPPCTEFSSMTRLSAHKRLRAPPDPKGPKGMGLVREAVRIIKEANPQYWALENVYGSREYIEPLLGKPRVEAKPFLLWGQFPEVMWPDKRYLRSFHQETEYAEKMFAKYGTKVSMVEDFPFDPLRSWKRAKIPLWVSQTLAEACNHTNPTKAEK